MTIQRTKTTASPFKLAGAMLLFMSVATAAFAIDDTPENRAKQVDRYFQAMPIETMTREMLERMVKQVPMLQQEAISKAAPQATPEQRDTITALFNDTNKLVEVTIKHLDFAAIKKIQQDALISTLTADEIAALADFYASPAGRSAGVKMAKFSEELMPAMMPIIMNAVIRAQAAERK